MRKGARSRFVTGERVKESFEIRKAGAEPAGNFCIHLTINPSCKPGEWGGKPAMRKGAFARNSIMEEKRTKEYSEIKEPPGLGPGVCWRK